MLARLRPGEQLPSVKEVVDALAINPNTVTKAYGELEHEGIVVRRQGLGTFVAAAPAMPAMVASSQLLNSLARWVRRARESGLSAEQIRMLVAVALDEPVDGAGDARGGEGIA
jgi:GntR family transcriptional regulator